MSDHHESPIKTPKQLITVVILAFAIPLSLIGLLVAYVTGGQHGAEAPQTKKPETVAERIKPVAAVTVRDANAPKVFQTGEQVYKAICAACHDTGAANAPKFGDKARWAPLIKEGYADLLAEAIKGTAKGMPPKGGSPDLDDYEVARAVVFMANASGAAFKEPAPPASPTAKGAPVVAGAAGTAGAAGAAPAVAAAAASTLATAGLPAKILFASGKAAVDAEGKMAIDAALGFLKANASAKVSISGYVDSTGNAAKNAELAKQRAFAVRDALKAGGVAETRISLKKPEEIKGGDSAEARRVEISLDGGASAAAATAPVVAAAAATTATAVAPASGVAGKALYEATCQTCHSGAIPAAPKFADKAAWAPRLGAGVDALTQSVIKGKGAMPPKGMAMTASDADIKAAVTYMVNAAK